MIDYWSFLIDLFFCDRNKIKRQPRIDNLCTIAASIYLEFAEAGLFSDVVRQASCHRLHGIAVRDGV